MCYKVGDKVMMFGKIVETCQTKDGTFYWVEPDYLDNSWRVFNGVKVNGSVLRISDDEVLKKMEEENKCQQKVI